VPLTAEPHDGSLFSHLTIHDSEAYFWRKAPRRSRSEFMTAKRLTVQSAHNQA